MLPILARFGKFWRTFYLLQASIVPGSPNIDKWKGWYWLVLNCKHLHLFTLNHKGSPIWGQSWLFWNETKQGSSCDRKITWQPLMSGEETSFFFKIKKWNKKYGNIIQETKKTLHIDTTRWSPITWCALGSHLCLEKGCRLDFQNWKVKQEVWRYVWREGVF